MRLKAIGISLAILMSTGMVWAQGTGSVRGQVVDPSGGAVAGASVAVTNTGTGISNGTTTDAQGNFELDELTTARYLVTVEKSGFKTFTQQIAVQAGRQSTLKAQLTVSASVQTVQVQATALPGATLQPSQEDILKSNQTTRVLGRKEMDAVGPLAGASQIISMAPGANVVSYGNTGQQKSTIVLNGNRMLYAEWKAASPGGAAPAVAITVRYHVIRRQLSRGDFAQLMRYNRDPWTTPVTLARYLQPDHLVPVDGKIRRLATANTQGKNGEIVKARAIYDYIFHNMRYDKSGAGWGRGDALWACDAHHGNCTDFHSLFISMARAEHIPARFQIGFPLPEDKPQGMIPGYHCWAEFYVDGVGWVPVDISEAWLDPARYNYYFGAIDASRVRFSTGRDLTLQPAQAGPPVNYFVYPYVELDGRPYEDAQKTFSFYETPLKAAPAMSSASRQAGGR